MILLQSAAHRARLACQSQRAPLSMTDRRHHEALASRAGRLRAIWSRNVATAALECRWDIQPPMTFPEKPYILATSWFSRQANQRTFLEREGLRRMRYIALKLSSPSACQRRSARNITAHPAGRPAHRQPLHNV
jgi:hypothetical protein